MFVIGADGLRRFLEMDPRSAMVGLGLKDSWIDEKLQEGSELKLLLLQRTAAQLATWDSVFRLYRQHLIEPIPSKVLGQEERLQLTPFEEVQRMAQKEFLRESSFQEVKSSARGRSHDPRYITDGHLLGDICKGTLAEVRGWLYNRMNLNELYDGSGWAKHEHTGELAVKEYIMPNKRVNEFEVFLFVDLNVKPRKQ